MDKECRTAGCHKQITHHVNIVVHYAGMEPWEDSLGYCFDDALYFAAWLPYCYPDKYELISITPPASELFKD